MFSGDHEGHPIIDMTIGPDGAVISGSRDSGEYEETVKEIVSPSEIKLTLDTGMIHDCQSVFKKFKLIDRSEKPEDGQSIMIVLEQEKALKMFGNIS